MSVRAHSTADGSYRIAGDHREVAAVNNFLRSLELRGMSPRTVRAYAHDAVVFVRWLEECDRSLEQISELDMLEFVADQVKSGSKPRSTNRRLTSCRQLVQFTTGRAIQHRPGIESPPSRRGRHRDYNLGLQTIASKAARKMRVKVPTTLIEPLTKSEVKKFLGRLDRYRDIAITYLMLLCGLRSREVLGLRIGDVDLEDCRLRVMGKGSKERVLPLPSTLRKVMMRYFEIERPAIAATDHVFLVLQGPRRGMPMTSEGLRKLFRHRRLDPDLSAANAHRFRHTFGTDMARARVRLPILQKMMGHAHPEVTLQYINLAVEDVAEEYERVIGQIRRRYEANGK